tara:strand:+ start:4840 stop:5685 length:846 start_codon:yes stop_codon:yes gene_type:complete
MAINKIDLTDVQNTQQGLFQEGFELTDYSNGSSIVLKAGRVEYVNGYPYRVEGGDETVTGSPSDGAVYLYIDGSGVDTTTALLSNIAPTWSSQYGGFYNGDDKAIFVFTKSGSSYNDRYRMTDINKDLGCQLGQIIDIHPEVIKKPNAFNFALCDNSTTLPSENFTKVNDTNAPDLTSKFIYGSSSYGTGGVDSHSLEHNHKWYDGKGSTNNDESFDASGTNANITTTGSSGSGGNKAIFAGDRNTSEHLQDNKAWYTDNQLSNIDNKPPYFQALKYMRIR